MKKLFFTVLLAATLLLWQYTTSAFTLMFPVDCQYRKDCFILYYVDADPGPGNKDFMGGPLSYNRHTGTDFGIATYAAMEQGVNIFASASGQVLRIRDGEPHVYRGEAKKVQSRQCGNGVLIRHERGYETQYCHLKQNSIIVEPGQEVRRGQVIAQLGSSGNADFPHLHIVVRHHGKVIDPFSERLWHPPIIYQRHGLIDMGISATVVNSTSVLHSPERSAYLPSNAENLISWVRVFGIEDGSRQRFVFYQPNGSIYREPIVKRFSQSYIEWFSYAGFVKRPGTPTGEWKVEYQLNTDNNQWKTLGQKRFQVE